MNHRVLNLLFVSTLVVGFSAAQQVFQDGDSCGVTSADFFKPDFGGNYRVAGTTGCDFSSTMQDCFCGVDYEDSDRLSEWKWQCNGAVKFGPADGKTCPATIPVPKELSIVGDNSTSAAASVECDTAVNPTGQRDDPVCAYSDCDSGGSSSSICGCVNKTKYGLGDGVEWFCMHSSCSCEPMAADPSTSDSTSGEDSTNSTSTDTEGMDGTGNSTDGAAVDDNDPTLFHEGETCGVTSADFFKSDFGGYYRVAGTKGCDLSSDERNCFCAVNYDDSDRLSEWKWQCNGAVEFGPAAGKTCPETIPVPKGLEVVSNALAVQDPVECDLDIHPTGQRGDPVCAYSDCDTGGSSSSICGCVNLTKYGMGEGVQWFCMHSGCSCKPVMNETSTGSSSVSGNTTTTNTTSTTTKSHAPRVAVPVVAALGASFLSLLFFN